MDFLDQLHALSNRIGKQQAHTKTEEATKNAFVMPFIQALGYDVFDPTEVVPEYIADVGSKKGEKVDYAILMNNKPTLIFECKCCDTDLDTVHAAQLRRYFHVTDARIGILTNGIFYRFYSDLEEKNIMAEKPFMEINMREIDEQLIPELKKLSKSAFEIEKMLSTASDLKYTREIKNTLIDELAAPTEDFVRFFAGKVYSRVKTKQVLEQFTPIVKKAFSQFINEQISDRLKSALAGQDDAEEVEQAELSEEPEKHPGIVTTEEEMEGFYIIRAILREVIDVNRIYPARQSQGRLPDRNSRC